MKSDSESEHGSKAVIYCRVSSAKQTTRGDGLGSQETRCREYARYKNLEVAEVFRDDMSGSLSRRPGMDAMLAFLRRRKTEGIVVIIDDISRLAPGIEAHLKLRAEIGGAGGVLKSPTIEFGEDSDSILVENLLASVSQHQRQKNGEQTINRMRARTLNGYWCFQAPIGYAYKRVSGHGNMLVRDEPIAAILQEALEGYASGRFETQAEVKRFLEGFSEFSSGRHRGELRNQLVADILTRPIYAGFVEAPNWNVTLRKGKHEGLISYETYQRIQERLRAKAKAPARKDLNADFPLRGFVCCADCQQPLTAGWSKSGSGTRHPYYLCHKRDCARRGKSIPRGRMEAEFDALLRTLQPTIALASLVKAMFRDAWNQRAIQAEAVKANLRRDQQEIDVQIDRLLERIVESDNASVVSAYEKKIAKLEQQKLGFAEKLAARDYPAHTFEEMFERALEFLSNPWKHGIPGICKCAGSYSDWPFRSVLPIA